MIKSGTRRGHEEMIAGLRDLDIEAGETTDAARRQEIALHVARLVESQQVSLGELGSHLTACLEAYPRAASDVYPL